jgi:hypothetical protein
MRDPGLDELIEKHRLVTKTASQGRDSVAIQPGDGMATKTAHLVGVSVTSYVGLEQVEKAIEHLSNEDTHDPGNPHPPNPIPLGRRQPPAA